jgi:hypothetical protein
MTMTTRSGLNKKRLEATREALSRDGLQPDDIELLLAALVVSCSTAGQAGTCCKPPAAGASEISPVGRGPSNRWGGDLFV